MNENLLNLLANCLQVYNTLLLERDASNDDILKSLQEQNTVYFERIIKQLDEIKNLLTSINKNNI